MFGFLLLTIILLILSWGFIPQSVKCKWGFHNWMEPTCPWWGGIEQGTYCCDHRMKIKRTYKKGGQYKDRRVPFTDEDRFKKNEQIRLAVEHKEKEDLRKQLAIDMRSDDYCEELLP